MDVSHLLILKDPNGSKTLAEVAALPDTAFEANHRGLSEGYTRTVHWLRFEARIPQGNDGKWWLEVHPSYLDDLRLYLPDPHLPGAFIQRRAGDTLPFSAREAPYRGFLFGLDLESERPRTLHLRVETSSTSLVMLKLWPAAKFLAAWTGEYALLGSLFGVLTIFLVINLIYWWNQREAVILHYIAYIAAALFNSIFVHGFGSQFLLPDHPEWVNGLQNSSAFLVMATASRLYMSVLTITPAERWLWWLYRTAFFASLVMIASVPLGHYNEAMRLMIGLSLVTTVVAAARSAWLMTRGMAGGPTLFVATLISLLALLLVMLQLKGLFHGNFLMLHLFVVSIVGNIIALHLAIGANLKAVAMQRRLADDRTQAAETKARFERESREEQAHFIGMLAHELKTPIAGVQAAVDAIEILEAGGKPEVAKRIDRIRRAVRRINGVAERYLQMDVAEISGLQPKWIECALSEIVENAISLVADSKNRVRVQINPEVQLVADPNLLATALLNLVDNALKYAPEDVVDILGVVGPHSTVTIEVADRGDGVPESMHAAIFDRYVRNPKHTRVPGIGLGLALARKITELHGGKINVLDREGGGTVFRVVLPCAPLPGDVRN